MREKLELSSLGFDSGSRKCKRGYNGNCGGVWGSLNFAGVWCQAVVLYWRVWQEFGFSRREDFVRRGANSLASDVM
jgi:hypothetical protein